MKAYLDDPIHPGPLRVLDIRVMHGANYFSGGPVVIMRLDLGEYDEVFTNQIPGFLERLQALLPTLAEHHCSEGKTLGFFSRVSEGTLLGHVTEHVTIELQTLAGMDVAYGKTRSTSAKGVYNVVYRFFDEVAGVVAGKAAVNMMNSILLGRPFDTASAITTLVEIREKRLLGPSTQAIVKEARQRGIPFLRLDEYNLVQLGTGRYQKRIRATITSDTDYLAVETADNKRLTTLMLTEAGIPVPETVVAERLEEVIEFQARLKQPLVIKPRERHMRKGVTVRLDSDEEISEAFGWARQFDEAVLVQPFVSGNTYRVLVIDYQMVAAAQVTPPVVVGDGRHRITELIEILNREPDRGVGDKSKLTRVEVDEITQRILRGRGYSLDTVLPAGETLPLKLSGSLRSGGSARDVTDEVHPFNRFLAERAAKVIGLNVAGLDIVAPSLSTPILENGGVCIGATAAPDLRLHLSPTHGAVRAVAGPIVDMLFPAGSKTRIPVFSVTGTLGKTTTVNLLAHCLKLARYHVGLTSTEGLSISDKMLMKGDMTYPEHVALVLKDPTIDCAVLETAREGILRRGIGYELADFGIVLNMYEDHVGSDDIRYVEDLAYAKSVVAEQVYDDGYAVLNADNDLVLDMRDRVRSHLALFSRSYSNRDVREHADAGGLGVVLDRGDILVLKDRNTLRVTNIDEIPLTHQGKAHQNYDNILAAVAALFAFQIPLETIRYGLRTFYPDPAKLPGRMNVIQMGDFTVLVDYAHNRESYLELKEFLRHFTQKKLGVIDAPGDRSDHEIIGLGEIAARTYDEVYVYEGFDRRGRPIGEIAELLKHGLVTAGFAEDRITTFMEPEAAWRRALGRGGPERMVVILTGRAEKTLRVIEAHGGNAK
ncbi:MAG: cyanophycin synthetase [Acidobacteriota bacterium]